METTNDNLIDKQLYISMQQGNKKAFDTLFIKYYAMLCAFARSFVSLEDAEEVVQDTMLQIWENRKTNHIDSSVHHYLFKAVKNKCYTLMTRNSLRFQIENILTPDIQELFEDPDFYIIDELTQKIEKAILNLPESYRIAFEMHRFQNKTYQEIAEELNISVDTVRNYFGGRNYREGESVGIHIEKGPDGGLVTLDDSTILNCAKRILGEI